MKIFVGCSSSNDISNEYLLDCKQYLDKLLKTNDVVFGACNMGLMGMSYDIAKRYQNKVVGLCPEAYQEDLKELECDISELTKTIADRTIKLIEYADAIVFLPGGIGTIYELMSTIESKRSHEFDKPIIIYNSLHFFDQLLIFLEKIYDQNFTDKEVKNCYHISYSAEDTINYLDNYQVNNDKKYILHKND